MTVHALAWLRASVYPVVVLEGVLDYYPRFEFEPVRALRPEPPYPVLPAAWQAHRSPAHSPQVRGAVQYPTPSMPCIPTPE